MNGWSELDRFLGTDPRDVGCAEAMEMLHVYADSPSPVHLPSSATQESLPTSALAARAVRTSRLRGILGGLLLLFGLLSRCLSGSSHVDQREAGHQQRQDGHGSTEGHPIFRLCVV